MKVTQTDLPGPLIIEPDVFDDDRGFFMESYNRRRYAEHGLATEFVQDNLSYSAPGVLRGLHFQHPNPQGKLVHVLEGEVFDVAVDIRVGSPTFGRWTGATLSAANRLQFYVPEGFAHGFVVTGEAALFAYKCTDFYDPEADGSARWDDPQVGIEWPVSGPVLSQKDRNALTLVELAAAGRLPEYRDSSQER